MQKNTFPFCLFFIISIILINAPFVATNAQEPDFLYGDEVTPQDDKSAEYLIPDSPFTEDEKGDKKNNEIKSKEKSLPVKNITPSKDSKESKNLDEKPLYNPAEPTTTPVDQDNPLSFNFLYYIIQKFKFADVIDE